VIYKLIIDKDILTKACEGDNLAFEKIIIAYSKRLYGFIYNIVHDKESALDITQDTFTKAYQNINTFKSYGNFTIWIFTIARNNSFNYLKKSKNEITKNIYDLNSLEISAKENDPQDIHVHKTSLNNIIKLIDELPEKYRTLIYLKYIENLSYKEISDSLNISIALVKSRLYAARENLLEMMKNNELEGYK